MLFTLATAMHPALAQVFTSLASMKRRSYQILRFVVKYGALLLMLTGILILELCMALNVTRAALLLM